MKNDYSIGKTKISIPPTLLVTAVGQLEDSSLAITMDVKRAGDVVYLMGDTYPDMGASQYLNHLDIEGGSVPKLRSPDAAIRSYRWLHRAIRGKLVASCHDLSDGGLGVALAESAFAGGLGMVIDLRAVEKHDIDRDDLLLFSETPGRILITVPQTSARAFEIVMGDLVVKLGFVSDDKQLSVTGLDGETVIDASVFELKKAWKAPLSFKEVR
jgi:phosphoribosylformylglycinamidine synthase